jgi:predicted AAA+ superfamily ATPase
VYSISGFKEKNMFRRNLEKLIEELLHEFRIVYLTGPRQSGKTTLVQLVGKNLDMKYLTLDDTAILSAVDNDPQSFIQSFQKQNIVLDEFQYSPNLIPAIKQASDQLGNTHKGKFLLTGSADIFKSAKVQESLPGHMARLELYPLSITEINDQPINIIDYLIEGKFENKADLSVSKHQVAEWIMNGGYPEIQSKSHRGKSIWFKSYLQGRLLKDFETLYTARGDYQAKLSALIAYLSGLCGNLLKYANISNDLEMDDKSVKTYINILELMFIVKTVPAYLKNRAKRQATRMPKLHFVDTGLACYLLGLKNYEQLVYSQYYGGLFENLIFMELIKHTQWALSDVSIYHFRDKRKNEVDMVLEQSNGQVIGVEIKASATVGVRDFRGLKKFAEFSGDKFSHGVVFYTGTNILPFHQENLKMYALPIGVLN